MTTEERAREISESFYRPENGYNDEELYLSAMAMADWMAEKACEWLKDNIHDYYATGDGGDEFEEWFGDMFEDFRKAMKEEIGMTKEDKEPRLAKENKESILTKKNKELLLKDLCSKLPYGVMP